ncbi:MAG TPA: hypothetical protein VMB52_03335 [Verrucomicrobiae bacterium]|nr:hypothetical protein [Verrucomicrobiae bacterium]
MEKRYFRSPSQTENAVSEQAVQTAVQHAHQYIIDSQQEDGSFALVTSSGISATVTTTLLLHSILLDMLCLVDDPALAETTARLASWMAGRIDSYGPRGWFSKVDTAAAFTTLASLFAYQNTYLTQDLAVAAIRFLVDNEMEIGGPYRNVVAPHSTTPEPTTNVSINRFIAYIAQPLPKLTILIDTQWDNQSTAYYTATWPTKLHTRRQTFQASLIADELLHTTTDQSPMTSASSSLLVQIVQAQCRDGSWPVEHICRDPAVQQAATYGISALTTCMMLITMQHVSTNSSYREGKVRKQHYAGIVDAAHHEADAHGIIIAPTLHAMLDRLIKADGRQEIGPLAARFVQTAHVKRRVPESTLETLGIANLYSWVAYTIYDDFLDDEGVPALLSSANVALRQSVALFTRALPTTITTQNFVSATFDTIDTANAWEIAHCRFRVENGAIHIGRLPDYEQLQYLYQRSLSHSLPIIGTLCAGGYYLEEPATQCVYRAFKNYLIIRQLSDDLYDWDKDLREGHISYVVMRLLQDAHISRGEVSLPTLVSQLERTFWYETLPVIGEEIMLFAHTAHELLTASGILEEDNTISRLVAHIEQGISRTLRERNQTKAFLQSYRHTR